MQLGTIYLEAGSWNDVAALRDFYRDTLRLSVRSVEDGESVWFDAGGTSLGFHVGEPSGNPGAINLSFNVDDLDAVAARLKDEGVTLVQEPTAVPWGGRVATLYDPRGHGIWLSGA